MVAMVSLPPRWLTDIPTLSQWALLLGGGLLVGMALLAQVRRTRPLRG